MAAKEPDSEDAKKAGAKKTVIYVVIALVALGLGIWLITRSVLPPPPPLSPWNDVWYYDLSTRKIFLGKENLAPPFATGSGDVAGGGAGVRAEVYSCGSCDDENQRFVAWLWKFTPEVRADLQAALDALPNGIVDNSPYDSGVVTGNPDALLIADPARPEAWYSQTSEDAQEIQNRLQSRCTSGKLVGCQPK